MVHYGKILLEDEEDPQGDEEDITQSTYYNLFQVEYTILIIIIYCFIPGRGLQSSA